MRVRLLVVLCSVIVSTFSFADNQWATGIREGGGGFYLSAPDQNFHLNLLGYGQFLGTYFSDDYRDARTDRPIGFQIRRARFTAMATVQRNYEFLMEMGLPTIRPINGVAIPGVAIAATPAAAPTTTAYPAAPDFGLVEARLTFRLAEDWLQMRVGKFVGPFSAENWRLSQNLNTVERSTVLNSMHTLPALDTQIGVMLFGRIVNGILNYYFGVFNGNGHSLDTSFDSDGDKEFQAKVVLQPHANFLMGLGYDYNDTPKTRLLSLVDHAFAPFVTGATVGARHGISFDFDWTVDFFNWRTEANYFTFQDSKATSFMQYLFGGYSSFGFMLTGDKNKGAELIARYEFARATVNTSFDLHSAVVGFNIFLNSNMKNVVQYIAEIPTQANPSSTAYSNNKMKHIVMNELQVKF